jgi:hypothetical protein
MVLAHYGQLRTEEEVRHLLGTGPHGTRAAVPPIVFIETSVLDYWKQRCNHVAVVVGLEGANVSLNDPYFDIAPQQTSLDAFRQAWASNDCWAAFIRPQLAGW